MISIPTQLNLEKVLREVNELDFWLDGSGAYMAMRPSCGVPADLGPWARAALWEIALHRGCGVLHAMVNRLPAGVEVPVHVDRLKDLRGVVAPHVERWHLPLITNSMCSLLCNDEEVHMTAGSWWGPVTYWLPHSVKNLGKCERVHLVVDLDKEYVSLTYISLT